VIGNAILIAKIATGELEDSKQDAAAVARGKAGGTKREVKLTSEQKAEIAKIAAQARWKKTT
jgi:hypothetical protein